MKTLILKHISKYIAALLAAVLVLAALLALAPARAEAYIWPDRDLVQGLTGEDVLSLQTRLAELGYNVGALDGYFGAFTEAAVIAFQENNGLYQDGVVGAYTLSVLYDGQSVTQGSSQSATDTSAASGGGQNASGSTSSGDTTSGSTTSGNVSAATISRSLSRGMSGNDVQTLQQLLENAGYSPGGIDGVFGGLTEAAVIAFQQANGLYVDGVAGPYTLAALSDAQGSSGSAGSVVSGAGSGAEGSESSTGGTGSTGSTGQQSTGQQSTSSTAEITSILSRGSGGSQVVALQNILADLGYYSGGADGDFGAYTEAAVVAFQSANHLDPDGIVGPLTLAALNSQQSAAASQQSGSSSAGQKTGTASSQETGEPETKEPETKEPETKEPETKEPETKQEVTTVEDPEELAIDPNYTGFATRSDGDWYYINGKIDTTRTSYVKTTFNGQTGWWYVKNGKVMGFIGTPQLTHISMAKNGVQIDWNSITGVAKYRVFRLNSAGEWSVLADTSNTYYIDTSVTSGGSYTYTVRAISPDGGTFLSDFDPNGLTLRYIYEYDNYVAAAQASVTKAEVERLAKNMGFDSNEIIALLGWVEGEAYFNIGEPYMAYLSACVMINGIFDGYYGRGEDVLKTIESWGSYYAISSQKSRYQNVSGGALMACYLALNHLTKGIHYCRGWSYKPDNCYYDSGLILQGSHVYVW